MGIFFNITENVDAPTYSGRFNGRFVHEYRRSFRAKFRLQITFFKIVPSLTVNRYLKCPIFYSCRRVFNVFLLDRRSMY